MVSGGVGVPGFFGLPDGEVQMYVQVVKEKIANVVTGKRKL